jgi:transcriptional regulator with XRE-family HTH domain
MDIGRVIKDLRKLRGLSQVELAAAASITQAALSSIENGTRPGEDTLARLCEALMTPVPVIYMLAMDRGDFTKKQQASYDILAPVLKSILLQLTG